MQAGARGNRLKTQVRIDDFRAPVSLVKESICGIARIPSDHRTLLAKGCNHFKVYVGECRELPERMQMRSNSSRRWS